MVYNKILEEVYMNYNVKAIEGIANDEKVVRALEALVKVGSNAKAEVAIEKAGKGSYVCKITGLNRQIKHTGTTAAEAVRGAVKNVQQLVSDEKDTRVSRKRHAAASCGAQGSAAVEEAEEVEGAEEDDGWFNDGWAEVGAEEDSGV